MSQDKYVKIDRDKYMVWDEDSKTSTLYIRSYDRVSDLDSLINEHLETLQHTPDDAATRYMLGNCLRGKGLINEARKEWEQVVASGDTQWGELAQKELEQYRQDSTGKG